MLEITRLEKTFNKNTDNEINIFKGLDLSFEKGQCTAIIGSNGCGKSSLMNMIGGSIQADAGSIKINGREVSQLSQEERSSYLGRVYQNPSQGVAPSLTILENMSLADKKGAKFSLRRLVNKNKTEEYRDLVAQLGLGLENIMDSQVKYLSGGQRQSLSLIMAAMKHPDLLLLDEHTAALDPKTSDIIMEKTKELIDLYKITTIMISHNLRDAIKYSDRIVMLDRGEVVFDRPSREVTEDMLNNIYKEKALAA